MTLDPLITITAIISVAAVIVTYFISRTPQPEDAAGARALEELQLQRDELSKLRFETTRDRDELRDHVGKHEQAIVQLGKDVRAAIVEVKTESSKLSLLHAQQPRRL